MLKKLLTRISLVIAFIASSYAVQATHIMGGSLSYSYLGIDTLTGNYNYLVRIELFRLCDPGSSLLPIDMNLGVYQDDSLNPGGDKILMLSTIVPIILQQVITPPNSNDSCLFAPNVCVEEGVYETIVSLPPSSSGYHFISDRCCRNNNIANILNPANAAEAYYAYAPDPLIVNSSPTFAVAPVPFICSGDTASVLNQAYDADGDLLIYRFGVPYNGIATGGNPNPNPPVNYPWPIPLINYAPNCSATNPFDLGGYASIDSTTGLSQYYAPNQGFYVVAVEIEEYRNSTLIGLSRRDIQVIVIACPFNPSPVLSTGTSQTTFTIDEGDTLCFNTTFNDANGDSIFISHTGTIFSLIPPATFIDSSGAGTATGQFCWITDCTQGQPTPYQFSVIATDNGCPAKITNIVYTINVNNTPKPGILKGPDTLCYVPGLLQYYHILPLAGYNYNWTITNGTIVTPINNDSVLVSFNGTGTAVLSGSYINHNGCVSDTISKLIFLSAIPGASAGPDVSFCSGGSANLGSPPTAGYAYLWTPATGLSSATVSNPIVTLTNTGASPITVTYILSTTDNGCLGSDTVNVTVNPTPAPSAGPDVAICSGNSVTIGSANIPGNTYSWTPGTGLSSTSVSNPVVTLTNTGGGPITQTYIVTVQNTFGCSSIDSVTVTINVVPTAAAGNDTSYCSGSTVQIGSPTVAGNSYSWNPSLGLSSSTVSDPTVLLTNSTGVNDTVYFVVTVSLGTCISTDTVMVIIQPTPVSNAGPDQLLCSGDTIQLGAASTAGYSYSWNPATGLSSSTISNPVLVITNTGGGPVTYTYVVTTTLNGCVSTDTVQITSGPAPTAVAGADTSYCSGSTVVIGSASQANYIYTWNPATGLSSSTVSNPTVTLTNGTGSPITVTYVLTTGLFGCFHSDTVQVTVNPSPISNAGPDATLCGGDTIQLGTSSTAGYVYTWTPGTGLSSTSISNPVFIASNSGTSQISITFVVTTNLNGCITTDTVTVNINPQPTVVASANPTAICEGASSTLTATGATGYSWALSTAPGVPISTDSILVVTPTVTTTYILTGTNASLCSNTNSVTITVNPLPAVQITAATDTICTGDTLTLTGTGATNYIWSVLGGGSLGTSNPIQVSPTVNTSYVVVGTDQNSCSNSDTISIVVNPAATISGISGTLSVCPGVNGVLYWVNNPNTTSTYTWVVTNGTIVSGQGTDTITVNWSSTPGAATVTVIEITDQGCMSPLIVLPVNINVLLTPVAPTGPTNLCANAALNLIYSTLNTSGSTYNWSALGGTIISGNGTSTVTVNWTTPGPAVVYLWYDETSITAVDTCFGTSDTLAITLNPAPVTGNISGPSDICINDSASFTVANTAASSYNWLINGGTITGGNGSNNITTTWNTSGTGYVYVIETNSFNCIGDTVMFPVNVHALPNANAGADVSVCIGQAVQLNATGGVSYSWTPITALSNPNISNPFANPSTPTVYTVLVTDNFGCKNTDSVLVSINSLPSIIITPNSSVCIGNSITLNAGGGTTFVWAPGGTLSNTNIPNPVATPTVTTTYTVVVTDNNTCTDSATVTITVNPLPTIVASADTIVCAGTGASLSASGGVSYSWAPASLLNNSNIVNPIATPNGYTVFTVTGTDANGCKNTDQVAVDVNVQPQASFTVRDGILSVLTCSGYSGSLLNTSVDALNYQWIFPNGSTSTLTDPDVQFNLSGNNSITLIAINNMCRDTAVVDFTSTAIDQLFSQMANVITPNGDGKNDCLDFSETIDLDGCSKWEVYNRWGKKVFTSSSAQPCWNGKKDGSGSDLSEGTYYILVHVADKTYHGSVELIRNK